MASRLRHREAVGGIGGGGARGDRAERARPVRGSPRGRGVRAARLGGRVRGPPARPRARRRAGGHRRRSRRRPRPAAHRSGDPVLRTLAEWEAASPFLASVAPLRARGARAGRRAARRGRRGDRGLGFGRHAGGRGCAAAHRTGGCAQWLRGRHRRLAVGRRGGRGEAHRGPRRREAGRGARPRDRLVAAARVGGAARARSRPVRRARLRARRVRRARAGASGVLPIGHHPRGRRAARPDPVARPRTRGGPERRRDRRRGAAYEAAIDAAGGIDLQVLGLGRTGHIGFNEPGSSLASLTRLKTLTAWTREDNARFFDGDVTRVPLHCVTQGSRHDPPRPTARAPRLGDVEGRRGRRGGRGPGDCLGAGLDHPAPPRRHGHRRRACGRGTRVRGLLPGGLGEPPGLGR